MNISTRKTLYFLMLSMTITVLGGTPMAIAENQPESVTEPAVAMLPMINHSGDAKAIDIVVPAIIDALTAAGYNVITSSELRPVLRKHRIRAMGMIGQADARTIAAETGIDYMLLGSVDFYDDGETPSVGISLRVLDVLQGRLIRAVSRAVSGDQYISLFYRGGVSRIDQLARRLADDVLADISHHLDRSTAPAGSHTRPVLAIVPFDEIDPEQRAGAIVSAYLLTNLVNSGRSVIEPGIVRDLFLRMGRAPRGEIDYELIDVLRDSLRIDIIITGAVDEFTTGGGGRTEAEISLGARLIDTHTRRILSSTFDTRRYTAGRGGLLSSGTAHAAGQAISRGVENIISGLAVPGFEISGGIP